MSSESRKTAERDFHNQREQIRRLAPDEHDSLYSNRRFYRTTGKSRRYLDSWFQERCPGKVVLDYCLRYFHLASIAAIHFLNTSLFGPVLSLTDAFDDILMQVPGVRHMAWQAVFELAEPL